MKSNTMIIAGLLCGIGILFGEEAAPKIYKNPQVDFEGFLKLSVEVNEVRQKRLVSIEAFNRMAAEEGTLILDTRPKKAFDDVHFKNAIHLNFSDFTEEKLAKVIPDKTTRILIYCNNNFTEQKVAALALKRVELALNVPTFVNLYGYGYKNIYELGESVSVKDPRVRLQGRKVEI